MSRRGELFAQLAAIYAELATLEGGEVQASPAATPSRGTPRSRPRRLRPAPRDDRPVSDIAAANAARILRREGIT